MIIIGSIVGSFLKKGLKEKQQTVGTCPGRLCGVDLGGTETHECK